jgi:WD40 repeat protein
MTKAQGVYYARPSQGGTPYLKASLVIALVWGIFSEFTGYAAETIAIAKVKHAGPVDFEREVLPILKNNCLACHNKTTTKGELNLETPQDMLKGGESGRAVAPKNGADSLLLKLASHQKKPAMPPRDNKVAASDLTPEELGLIKLWIDQGAKGSVRQAGPVEWKPVPETLNAIFAVALTGDGQFAAAARANRIYLYRLPLGQMAGELFDPLSLKTNLFAQAGVAHRDLVQSLAFSPDGNVLASGSYREVKLWRRGTNTVVFQLPKVAANAVTAVASSPDGKWFATGGDDGAVKLWDAAKGKLARTLNGGKGGVGSLKFSPDGTRLLAATADAMLRVWTVPDGKPFGQLATEGEMRAVAWLGDAQTVAAGGVEPVIRTWKLPAGANGTWTPGKELKGHTGGITALERVSGTNQLLSASADGTIRTWNFEKGESLRESKPSAGAVALAMRPDGKRVAWVGTNRAVRLWNVDKNELVAELKGDRHAQETLLARQRELTLATNELAYRKMSFTTATNAQKAALERVKKAKEADAAATKALAEKEKPRNDTAEAKAAAEKVLAPLNDDFKKATEAVEAGDKALKQAEADAKAAKGNPDKAAADKAAAESAAKTKAAQEAKQAADKKAAELKDKVKQATDKLTAADKAMKDAEAAFKKAEMTKSTAAHEFELAELAEKKTSEAVKVAEAAIGTAEAGLKRSATETAAALQAAGAAEMAWRAVTFSRDGRVLIAAGDDQMIHTWSAETGAPLEHYPGHKGAILALAAGANGQIISGAADRGVMVWETAEKWKLERTIGTGDAASPLVDRVNAVQFSPDGQWLATGGGEPTRGGEIKLWQWTTGKVVQSFTNVHSDTVFSLDFSPDGKYLASGAADKFMRVVDLATGKVVKAFEGHTHHVLGVSWRRDGRTLASAGADNVVKIWDFTTGERKKTVEGFSKEVTSVNFVGIGDQALASSGDNQVRMVNEKGEQVRAFAGAADFMGAAAVTPDGRIVVAGGQDSILRVWNGTNGEVLGTFGPVKKQGETSNVQR